MKILLVADQENRKIWDYYEPGLLDPYALILSAGDLKAHYLSFLATMSRAEVLYVKGNHDKHYASEEPEGCIPVDDHVYNFYGLRILGLGGSFRYGPGPCMYTEAEMRKRIRRVKREIKKNGGFDILLTHAPAFGFHDGEDLCHRGFQCFRELIEEYKPMYFIHGHMHSSYGSGFKRVDRLGETTVINACEKYEIEIPDESLPLWQNRIKPTSKILRDLRKKHKLSGKEENHEKNL
ncbi:MAG: metallophosphoesterase [Lachnospiraceae bacterium]|nr:metallophosphoesterase [Lachnospiraceae bacterium]